MKNRNLVTRIKTAALVMLLSLGVVSLISCGESGPEPEQQPTTHKITINSFSGIDVQELRSKSAVNGGRDQVQMDVPGVLGVSETTRTADFNKIREVLDLQAQRSNIKFSWGTDGGVFAIEDLSLLSSEAKTLSDLLKTGGKIVIGSNGAMFLIGLSDKNLFEERHWENLGIAGETIINNAQEFIAKCQSARAGDHIVINGNISLDIIDNAAALGTAIESTGGVLRIAPTGKLEFVVGQDISLYNEAKLDKVVKRIGDARIIIKVKVDTKTGVPYITAVNDAILEHARTAATGGKTVPGEVVFMNESGTMMHPVISGSRKDRMDAVTPAPADSTYFASISKLDAFHGDYSWNIINESGKLLGVGGEIEWLTVSNYNVTIANIKSPTGQIDLNYPTQSGNNWEQVIPATGPNRWIEPPVVRGTRRTVVASGDWMGEKVQGGQYKGFRPAPAVLYTTGFTWNTSVKSINITNADKLSFAFDYTATSITSSSGDNYIYEGGKHAVVNMDERLRDSRPGAYRLYFINSDGKIAEQVVALQGVINEDRTPPIGTWIEYDGRRVLLLQPQYVR